VTVPAPETGCRRLPSPDQDVVIGETEFTADQIRIIEISAADTIFFLKCLSMRSSGKGAARQKSAAECNCDFVQSG
jgi:hypothetical protein